MTLDRATEIAKCSQLDAWERSRVKWRGDKNREDLTGGVVWNGDAFVVALRRQVTLSEHTAILEIGPGDGRILRTLLDQESPFKRYLGVDLSEAWVNRLSGEHRGSSNIRFIHGDAETFHVEETVDLCFASMTFQHLYPTFEAVLKNVSTLLEPGGQIVFDFPWGNDEGEFQEDCFTYVRTYSQSAVRLILSNQEFGDVKFSSVCHGPGPDAQSVASCLVSAKKLSSPEKDTYRAISIPPVELIHAVVGDMPETHFCRSGEWAFDQLNAALSRAGCEMADFRRVLDWGCGCGRMTRHWATVDSMPTVHGCDIDRDGITWCQDNLTFADFAVCEILPPTRYEDNSFDLIYAGSVLTHLGLDEHFAWMREIERVLDDSGVFVFTYHGANYFWNRRLEKEYRLDLIGEEPFGESGDGPRGSNPIQAFTTIHALEWIFYPFEVLWNGPRHCMLGEQSTAIVRKKRAASIIALPTEGTSNAITVATTDVAGLHEISVEASGQKTFVVFVRKEGEQSPFSVKICLRGEKGEVLGTAALRHSTGRRKLELPSKIFHPVVVDFDAPYSGRLSLSLEVEEYRGDRITSAMTDGGGSISFCFPYLF